jgi:flagellar hook-length control protein FliK
MVMAPVMKMVAVQAPARETRGGGDGSEDPGGFQDVLSQVKREREPEPAQRGAGGAELSPQRTEMNPGERKDVDPNADAAADVADESGGTPTASIQPVAAVQVHGDGADEPAEADADELAEVRAVVARDEAKAVRTAGRSEAGDKATPPVSGSRGRAEPLQQRGDGVVEARTGDGQVTTGEQETTKSAPSERPVSTSVARDGAAEAAGRAMSRSEAGQSGVTVQAGANVNANNSDAVDMTSARPAVQMNAPAEGRPAAPAMPRADLPEVRFAEQNSPGIVTAVRTQLLPNGGSMQIRLDPPELGAMQVIVRMRDGVMTASFHTSSDEAARLLSHNLGQLRQALETAGMNVERLQVQQSPREESSSRGGQQEQSQQQSGQDGQHEQQRREMLQRMWRKLALGDDPLDLVA